MAYNPVPTVVTGDLWTASNHNTYIRDNFAAGVPGIIQAKGDLAVGSTVRAAGRLPVGANNLMLMADSSQSLGIKWGENPKILNTPLTNASWDGDSKSIGIYEITATTFNNSIPSDAKALFMSVVVQFPEQRSGRVRVYSGNTNKIQVIDVLAHDLWADEFGSGLVPLFNGKFIIAIASQNLSSIYVNVYGWIF